MCITSGCILIVPFCFDETGHSVHHPSSIKWASLHKSETRSVKRIQGLKKFYLNLKGLFNEFLFFALNKRIEFRNSCILDKQYIFTFNRFKYFPFKTESIREIQKCSSQKLFFIIEVIKV